MRRWLLLVPALGLGMVLATGCGDPCEKLKAKICDHVKDKRACERSEKDMADFTPEICANALAIYDRLYEK